MSSHSFNRGGQDDGTLTVNLDTFYGEQYVAIGLEPAVAEAHLTAAQARAVAADLLAHADQLDGRVA
jgi:hypothetical protein